MDVTELVAPPQTAATGGAVCEHCGKPGRYGIEPECRACYWPHAMHAPNVRIARALEQALEARFETTRQTAAQESWEPPLETLIELGTRTQPVVAVHVDYAYDMFALARNLHRTYEEQVDAGLRAPADEPDDARRRTVDALIYGGYGKEIHFAALSADGRGVLPWGPIFLQLSIEAVGYRATVLEDNAYRFLDSDKLLNLWKARTAADRSKVLGGHLSVWESRHKLVASKLGPALAAMDPCPDPEEMLIIPGAGREDSEFLEVHIFGPYNYQAVENIRTATTDFNQPVHQALFEGLKKFALQNLGHTIEVA